MRMAGLDPEYDELRVELIESGTQLFLRMDGEEEPLLFTLPPSVVTSVYEEISLRARRANVRSSARLTDASRDLGAQFFTALLQTRLGPAYHETVARAEREPRGIRIRVVTTGPMGHHLPWELLFDPVKNTYVALGRRTAIVRSVGGVPLQSPAAFAGPAKIVLFAANVTGDLQTELDVQMLQELVSRSDGRFQLAVIPVATISEIHDALTDRCDILYFSGTGSQSLAPVQSPNLPQSFASQGLAVFTPTKVTDKWEALDGRELASWAAKAGVRAAVLAACHTDVVAKQLAESGVSASVGFRGDVGIREMVQLSSALCRSLTAGDLFEEAVCEARHGLDLVSPGSRQWALATAYLQAPTGQLFPETQIAAPATPVATETSAASSTGREYQLLTKRKALDEQSLAALQRRMQEQSAAQLAVPELEEERKVLEQRIKDAEQRIAALSLQSA